MLEAGEAEKLPKAQPRRLVMDEFALFKGHRYASVVLDARPAGCCGLAKGVAERLSDPFSKR